MASAIAGYKSFVSTATIIINVPNVGADESLFRCEYLVIPFS